MTTTTPAPVSAPADRGKCPALAGYACWRWCLYVNLPIAATVARWFVLPKVPGHSSTRLDWFSGDPRQRRGWSSAVVLGSLAAAALLLGGLVLRQARVGIPLLPLTILTDRTRSFGMFLTYQLQAIMGFGAGLAFLLADVTVSTLPTRRLIPRTGPRALLVIWLDLAAGRRVAGHGVAEHDRRERDRFGRRAALPAATVHGYAVANGWAAGIVAAGAIAVCLLARDK